MAKKVRRGRSKGGVNKAQAIRDEIKKQGIETAPKQIIATLKKRGITVSPAQVSNIRTALKNPTKKKTSTAKKKKSTTKRKTTRRKAAAARRPSVSVDLLFVAKKFVQRMGGIDKARAALDVLSELS